MNRNNLFLRLATLLFVCCLSLQTVVAQFKNFSDRSLTKNMAAEGNSIWRITTAGLERTDLNGNSTGFFAPDPSASNTPTINFFSAEGFVIDNAGNKWITINRSGLGYMIVRFDGTNWTTWTKDNAPALDNTYYVGIAASTDGRIYTGGPGKVVEFANGTWTTLTSPFGLGFSVRSLVAHPQGGVIVCQDDKIQRYSTTAGWSQLLAGAGTNAFDVTFNAAGEMFYLKYTGEILKVTNGTAQLVESSPNTNYQFYKLVIDNSNRFWVCGYNIVTFTQPRVYVKNGATWQGFDGTNSPLRDINVDKMIRDAAGNIYLIDNRKLFQYNGTAWKGFYSGFVGGNFSDYDNNGNVYFAKSDFITKFNQTTEIPTYFHSTNSPIGQSIEILSFAVAGNGNIWVGSNAAIWNYNGTTWTSYTSAGTGGKVPNGRIRNIEADDLGNVWMTGVDEADFYNPLYQGLYRFNPSANTGTVYNVANGQLSDNNVEDIFMDTQNRLWFVVKNGGLRKLENNNITSWTTANSNIGSNNLFTVSGNKNGSIIWLQSGFIRFDGTTFTTHVPNANFAAPFTGVALFIRGTGVDNGGNNWIGAGQDIDGGSIEGVARYTGSGNPMLFQGTSSPYLNTTQGATFAPDNGTGMWIFANGGVAHYLATAGSLQATFSSTNLLCAGTNTGAISANISGGTPPYSVYYTSYNYETFDYNRYIGANQTGLPASTYNAYVKDALGNTTGSFVNLREPSALTITNSVSGNSSTATVTGGILPYSYLWSNGATTATVNNLVNGRYLVTTTDANGCTNIGESLVGIPPINFCPNGSPTTWNHYISKVKLGAILTISSNFPTYNYTQFYSTILAKGSNQNLLVGYSLNYEPATSYIRAWIDYNQNGTFEASEIILDKTQAPNATGVVANVVTQAFTVPTNANAGYTRMRVMVKPGSAPTGCNDAGNGDAEDYTIIIPGTSVGGNPCTPDVTPPLFANCPNNITITSTGLLTQVNWSQPAITDACGFATIVSGPNSPNANLAIGTTPVTYTGRDAANNTTTCSFTITVTSSTGGGGCTGNLLTNNGFESSFDNWENPNGATIVTDAQTGTKAMSLCPAGAGRVYQFKTATAGTNYTFKAFCKKTGTAPTNIFIKFMNSGFSPIQTDFQAQLIRKLP
jgi:GEVED domain/HYR domain/SprB repeat